jgi:hypothetical protein
MSNGKNLKGKQMNKIIETINLALEALEELWGIVDDIDTASDMAKANDAWYRQRVEFLQKKRWELGITTDGYRLEGGAITALRRALEQQPAGEPVAWIEGDEPILTWFKTEPEAIPLYTAPPPSQPWQGLTDEEFQWIYDNGRTPAGMIELAEAKLKEKNT